MMPRLEARWRRQWRRSQRRRTRRRNIHEHARRYYQDLDMRDVRYCTARLTARQLQVLHDKRRRRLIRKVVERITQARNAAPLDIFVTFDAAARAAEARRVSPWVKVKPA